MNAPEDVPPEVTAKLRELVANLDRYEVWLGYIPGCRPCGHQNGTNRTTYIISAPDSTDGGIYCAVHGLLAFDPLSDLRPGVTPLGNMRRAQG
jgi:hypothetical protein